MTNEYRILTAEEVAALRKCGKCGGELSPVLTATGNQRSFASAADGIVKHQWKCVLGHNVWLVDEADPSDSVAE